MQQVILIVVAIILGLMTGKFTGGTTFSALVCVVAGIFLVTPSLFKFRLSDLSSIKDHMPSVGKNLWVNYLLLTSLALAIGYASQDIGIAAALFLLALLPGGGMVMMWIKQSGANVKLGFIIFMLNLILLLPVTLIFSQFQNIAGPFFPEPNLSAVGHIMSTKGIMPLAPFIILIVVPFVLSRIALKFFPAIVQFTGKHQQTISKTTMFGIVFYLFSLSTSQLLFEVSLLDLAKAFAATAAFYAVAIGAAIYFSDNSANDRAVFWHIATRYITLALILAVFNVDTFGASFILPIMIAYFIQMGSAGFLSRRQIENTG
ncbi:MAG: hypothetical protein L3J13_01215 [Devosiaceae bacterium]|nr:hypothetical protein [Devosiaceae bacterium]